MSKILDLLNYDLVFTTSFEHTHGISGHLYEMAEYFYICSANGINCAILLSDGTKLDTFKQAVITKYDFDESELSRMFDNTIECHAPRLIRTKNLCIVDGSARLRDCIVYSNNVFLLRCFDRNFAYFANHKTIKRTHLMQDYNVYPERYENLNIEVIDYVKKILWKRCIHPKNVTTNTAMFYLTTNCRALPVEEVENIVNKHRFEKYLIITNDPSKFSTLVSDKIIVAQAPVKNIFEQFDTYIYTPTPRREDCSPRFIVECAASGKQVLYDIDYHDPGVEARRKAISTDLDSILLKEDDLFVDYVLKYIYD